MRRWKTVIGAGSEREGGGGGGEKEEGRVTFVRTGSRGAAPSRGGTGGKGINEDEEDMEEEAVFF